jgi:hypothetical protein
MNYKHSINKIIKPNPVSNHTVVPQGSTAFTPLHEGHCEVAVAWCDRVAAVWLEEPLEMVESLAGMSSRPANRAEARMMVQLPREVPVMMTGDHWPQKHIDRGEPTKGPWRSRWAALRKEQLGNSSARPNPRGMKAGCHRDQKQKHQGRHHIEIPFIKAFTDVTDMSPWRRNGDMPIGYSRWAALRREKCDMTEKCRSSTRRRLPHWFRKGVWGDT